MKVDARVGVADKQVERGDLARGFEFTFTCRLQLTNQSSSSRPFRPEKGPTMVVKHPRKATIKKARSGFELHRVQVEHFLKLPGSMRNTFDFFFSFFEFTSQWFGSMEEFRKTCPKNGATLRFFASATKRQNSVVNCS